MWKSGTLVPCCGECKNGIAAMEHSAVVPKIKKRWWGAASSWEEQGMGDYCLTAIQFSFTKENVFWRWW